MNNHEVADDDQEQEVVRAQLGEFVNIEGSIREFLDNLIRLKIRNQQTEVRNELRQFASAYEDAFRFLANILNNTDGYYVAIREVIDEIIEDADPDEKVDDEEVEKIIGQFREFGTNYSTLSPTVNAVYLETFHDRMNPITNYDSFPGYSSTHEPLVTYQARSGETTVFETRNSVGMMTNIAWTMTGAVSNSIKTVIEQDREINSEELERIKESYERLDEHVSELGAVIDQIDEVEKE